MIGKMNWKDRSYAKKGALVAGGISIVGIFIAIININHGSSLGLITIFAIPFALFGLLFGLFSVFGCDFYESVCPAEHALGFIVTLIVYSLIGAFIGWIVGKIKNKS
jgi:hypothetical protein